MENLKNVKQCSNCGKVCEKTIDICDRCGNLSFVEIPEKNSDVFVERKRFEVNQKGVKSDEIRPTEVESIEETPEMESEPIKLSEDEMESIEEDVDSEEEIEDIDSLEDIDEEEDSEEEDSEEK